jgi:lysine 2,3-aminomutase
MQDDSLIVPVTYKTTGETTQIPLFQLINAATNFLDNCVHPSWLDQQFIELVGEGDGNTRFEHLLSEMGFDKNPHGFFVTLLVLLGEAGGKKEIVINGVTLPHQFLMSILEIILPGNRFISIKNIDQLEKHTNILVPKEQHEDMQKVLDTYPVRLSMHTIRQMRISDNVAYQYLPFIEELDTVGQTNTWIGQFHQGLLEQMYSNRVIFLLYMGCPVYCRFCFRKHKESRNAENPSTTDVLKAVEHVSHSPAIKEIVVTGGDPFMSRDNMACTVDNLSKIDHVRTLRLATRSIAYYPHLFLNNDGEYLDWVKEKSFALQQTGKRMEVATHFIHPDEVSPQSLFIISEMVRAGIGVYIQTPFLKDCNDEGPELVRLFSLLRGAGAEIHYIYIPCSPIHGNSIYWSPISSGINVASYLRAHLSDRAIPRICTATPIGKMDWFTSGWAVEPVAGEEDLIWIRTPYTPDYFKNFAPLTSKLDNIRVNDEGTIDIQYFAKIGNEDLFIGALPPAKPVNTKKDNTPPIVADLSQNDHCLTDSIVATGIPHLYRQHETRVELNVAVGEDGMQYIQADNRITDVIISTEEDPLTMLGSVERLVHLLAAIPHVNSVRLRSLMFNSSPERFTRVAIDRLAEMNRLSIVGPLRLEIETRFYQVDEITDEHTRLVRKLNNRGITVYNCTQLISGVNDNADTIQDLAFAFRKAGIEFHHLYVAGLPQQELHNLEQPVDMRDIIDIATRVRREGSGREIPRYIIRTPLGEVDYGLTTAFDWDGGFVWAKLLPYTLSYFQNIDPGFIWPQDTRVDGGGVPSVKLVGLTGTGGFALA